MENKTFKVWIRTLDGNGNPTGVGVYPKEYKSIITARARADRFYNDNSHVEVAVGVLNPFESHTRETVCELCEGKYDVPIDPEYGYDDYSSVALVRRINHQHPRIMSAQPINRPYRVLSTFKKICPSCVKNIDGYLKSLAKEGTDV